jgi:hypothetical protein
MLFVAVSWTEDMDTQKFEKKKVGWWAFVETEAEWVLGDSMK